MNERNVISEIKLGPSLLIAVISAIFGIIADQYIAKDFGKSYFLSALMIMLATYSCREFICNIRVFIYICLYSALHIILSVAAGEFLEPTAGPTIILIAIMDYALFYLGAQFFCRTH